MKVVSRLAMIFVNFSLVFLLVIKHASCHGSHDQVNPQAAKLAKDQELGRIQEFDTLILMNIDLMMKEKREMDMILEQGTQIMQSKIGTYDEEMARYYVEMLKLIKDEGLPALHGERERINVIFSSQPPNSGLGETEYAVKRRNVIDWFSEANAQFIMRDMDKEMGMFDINNPDNFEKSEL